MLRRIHEMEHELAEKQEAFRHAQLLRLRLEAEVAESGGKRFALLQESANSVWSHLDTDCWKQEEAIAQEVEAGHDAEAIAWECISSWNGQPDRRVPWPTTISTAGSAILVSLAVAFLFAAA